MTEKQIMDIAINLANTYFRQSAEPQKGGNSYTAEYFNYMGFAIGKVREFAQVFTQEQIDEQVITLATNMADTYFRQLGKTQMDGNAYTAEYLNYLAFAVNKTKEFVQYISQENQMQQPETEISRMFK